jgi:hypothetical protein
MHAKAKSGCLDFGYFLIQESVRFARHLTARRQLGLCVTILLLMGPVCRINAQEIPEELAKFLKDRIGLTGKDLLNVDRGEAISKVLRSEGQEVAVFGIVRVNAPENFFLERFRDIESYKKGTSVPFVKKFSTPPRIEDLDQLTLDKEDFESLKNCRIGNCNVKLSAQAMKRLQSEIDWNSPNASARVNELARAALLDYVNRYLANGNKALTEYNDKKTPLRVADEFDAILKASPYIYDYEPEFYAYLREYPAKRLDDSEDFIYWSKEKFGLKPVISVTHASIYRKPGSGRTLIASKQIYASHYFEASLGLTAVVGSSQQSKPGFYLLYLNRSRSDALHGGFSGLARGQVKRTARNGMQKNMFRIKSSIENLWERSEER